jgi:hypothetical protein
MARNRKKRGAVRAGPLVLVIVLCLFFGGAGVGYVWQVKQVHALGQQIKERENRLAELQRQNKLRRDHLSSQCSPVALEARVQKLNLGLMQPPMSQVVRLVDVLPQAAPSGLNQFADAGERPESERSYDN